MTTEDETLVNGVARLTERLRELGPQTQNQLYDWWCKELGNSGAILQSAAREMLRTGAALARRMGAAKTMELATDPPKVDDIPLPAADPSPEEDNVEAAPAVAGGLESGAVVEAGPAVTSTTIGGQVYDFLRPARAGVDGPATWVWIQDAGRILGLSPNGTIHRLRAAGMREMRLGAGERAPLYVALKDVVMMKEIRAGYAPARPPTSPEPQERMILTPMTKREFERDLLGVPPVEGPSPGETSIPDLLTYRCNITGGRHVVVKMPRRMSTVDVARVTSFLSTQVNDP